MGEWVDGQINIYVDGQTDKQRLDTVTMVYLQNINKSLFLHSF